MKEMKFEVLKNIFIKNNGYAHTKDILSEGIHFRYITELEEKELIIKVKRGLYKWANYELNDNDEIVEVCKVVSNGVICLLSALAYYDLTTYNPWEYYVAIHRDSTKVKNIEYPPIKLIYFSDKQFNTGITTINMAGNEVKIYDKEKTICDCVRYRNKIGMDIFKEALKEYLKCKDRNINKLMEYAEYLGVKNVLKDYLEVLI